VQYQAASLSKLDNVDRVTLVGYEGEKCIDPVIASTKITVQRFSVPAFESFRRISLLHAILRGLAMVYALFATLWAVLPYDVILIQNPPCLPALFVAYLFSICFRNKIVIDWHNLGFKMFEEKLGPKHVLVRLSKWLERRICQVAVAHVCVSQAMSVWLLENFVIKATVFYYTPANIYNRTRPDILTLHRLFVNLGFTDTSLFPFINLKKGGSAELPTDEIDTIQTEQHGSTGNFEWRQDDFCPLIISSTSWTPDEDFNLFLEALLLLNNKIEEVARKNAKCTDRVLVAITGKGPMKEQFLETIRQLEEQEKLTRVCIRTVWLEPAGLCNRYGLVHFLC
jgi:beta-1,4-mannosyltransferase